MTRRLPAPRWQTPLPPGVAGSYGPIVGLYCRRGLGFPLDTWQQRAINRALAHDEAMRLVHSLYLISTGRQQGKTLISRVVIGAALTELDMPEWSSILGLAHDRAQASIPYRAILADLAPIARRVGPLGRGGLALTRYLGIRSNMYGRHREYKVASREARDSARGETHDLVNFDEVRTQRDFDSWGAVEPTMTASRNPLTLATSTAGDDRSVLLRDWWERGIRIIDGAEPPGGFGMTWYAAPDDAAPDDPRAIYAANPAIAAGRLSIASVLESRRTLSPAFYRSERLNLWTVGLDEWLPSGVWPATAAPPPAARPGAVVLGVDVVPSWRRATVYVAFLTPDGAWAGPVGDLDATRAGASSIAPADLVAELDRIADMVQPAAVAYSATSAAGRHVKAWAEARDVRDLAMGAREVRAASQLFRSELVGGRLRHQDDPLTALQVRRARPSGPLEGGEWYLSVRESTGEIDAVRAAAWAAWAAIDPPEPEKGTGIHV